MDVSGDAQLDVEEMSRVSLLLVRASDGDDDALGLVFDEAYAELRSLAEARLRRSSGQRLGLDAAGLVNELFLRLAQRGNLKARHRAPFFKYAAQVMRSVIIDGTRVRSAQRRGGTFDHRSLGDQHVPAPDRDHATIRLHDALTTLAEHDRELADLVSLRFYCGLTDEELAETLGITDRTVRRRWDRARTFLQGELAGG